MSDSDLDSRPSTPMLPLSPVSDDRDAPASAVNPDLDMDDADNISDNESELSEVDEDEFADFDPTTVALDDRPQISIDEDVAKSLKAGKKKRVPGEKKPKEKKREKKKRARDDDEDPDGQLMEGKRTSKKKSVRADGERREKGPAKERRQQEPENEENLDPAERRRRALDRAMDDALKNPAKRRRKKDEVVCSTWEYEGLFSNTDLGS